MLKKRKIIIFLLTIIIILIIVSIQLLRTNNLTFKNYTSKKMEESTEPNLVLKSYEENNVLLKFNNLLGIKQIEYPNGMIIYCNGKKSVAIDYKVEANKTYEFKITDIENNTKIEEFVTPMVHIEISKNDIVVDMEQMKEQINSGLNENLIATNFIKIGIGEQNYVDSKSTDMATVFNNWTSFGDGNWSYDSSSKTIKNSKNTDYFTGYYNPNRRL